MTVDEIEVADAPEVWARAGFSVDADDISRVGGVRIRLTGREKGSGILGWSVRGVEVDGALDGIVTRCSEAEPADPATHANGVTAIDHIVVASPDLGRTVAALAAVGVQPRRERDGELGGRPIRQVFFRFGPVIVEVVGAPGAAGDGPSSLWGITYVVADIDATAAFFGAHATPVKDAVQPGRRITTLDHRALGMSVRTALISGIKLDG
jgi:hypothetical protein